METFIIFHGNLQDLLKPALAGEEPVCHHLARRASIKDVVESLGVPHPEIVRLTVNGREVSFAYIVEDSDRIEVWPLAPPVDLLSPSILRPESLTAIAFVVDVNVGKLARLLRMAGLDAVYRNDYSDDKLAEIAAREKRILLTRDNRLLRRRIVEFGHLVREIEPKKQFYEIVRLYGLREMIRPFTRCLCCNGLLEPVAKEEIVHRLKPLTRKYYETFHICRPCGKIYWPGSHRERMQEYLAGLL